MIDTNHGKIRADDLWNRYYNEEVVESTRHGHELMPVDGLDVLSYDTDKKCVEYSKVGKLSRHKVSKRKFKIKCGDREVIMTEDHGLMVMRGDDFIRISPKEYRKGDKILTVTH